jgi:hypothetical protein
MHVMTDMVFGPSVSHNFLPGYCSLYVPGRGLVLGDDEMQRYGWPEGWVCSCCAINLLLFCD